MAEKDTRSSKTKYIESQSPNAMTKMLGSISRGFDKFRDATGIDLTQEEEYKAILEKAQKKAKGGGVHRMPDGTMMKDSEHGMKKGGSTKWIQSAIKKPGALRKSLGVKAGKTIPAKTLAGAAKKPGKLGQRARLAQTLKKMK